MRVKYGGYRWNVLNIIELAVMLSACVVGSQIICLCEAAKLRADTASSTNIRQYGIYPRRNTPRVIHWNQELPGQPAVAEPMPFIQGLRPRVLPDLRKIDGGSLNFGSRRGSGSLLSE